MAPRMARTPLKGFGGWHEIATEFNNLDAGLHERLDVFTRSGPGVQRRKKGGRSRVRLQLSRRDLRLAHNAGDVGNSRLAPRGPAGASAGSRRVLRKAGGRRSSRAR